MQACSSVRGRIQGTAELSSLLGKKERFASTIKISDNADLRYRPRKPPRQQLQSGQASISEGTCASILALLYLLWDNLSAVSWSSSKGNAVPASRTRGAHTQK